jgi:hypothetical protein
VLVGLPKEAPYLVGKRAAKRIFARLNPVDLRDEFYSMPETTNGLLSFLNTWGAWDGYADPRATRASMTNLELLAGLKSGVKTEDLILDRLSGADYLVDPLKFWEMRRKLMVRAKGPKNGMQSNYERFRNSIATVPRFSPPFFVICHDGASAIETQITIDSINDILVGTCALSDCRNAFIKGARKERIYCSRRCAHLAAVRRSREEKA